MKIQAGISKFVGLLFALAAVNAQAQKPPPVPSFLTIYSLKSRYEIGICRSVVDRAISDAEISSHLARLKGQPQRVNVRDPGSDCTDKLRGDLRQEYDKVQAALKTPGAKAALKEHYVLIRKSMDDLDSFAGQTSSAFDKRTDQNISRAEEQWQRFLVEVE